MSDSATPLPPPASAAELLDTIAPVIFEAGPDGRVRSVNGAWQSETGLSPDALVGSPLLAFIDEADRERVTWELERVLRGEVDEGRFECRVRLPGGAPFWVQIDWRPRREPSGAIVGVVASVREFTEALQSRAALEARVAMARRLLAWSRRLQHAATFEELLDAVEVEVFERMGYSSVWLYRLSEDGRSARLHAVRGPTARLVDRQGSHQPMEGDPFLEEIARAEGPVIVDDARTDRRTDPALVASLGNRTIVSIPLVYGDRRLGVLGTGTFAPEPPRPPTQDELDYLVAMSGQIGVAASRIAFAEERAEAELEKKRLEARVLHAQKLESLGLLAGGVAHDFSNLLVGVIGHGALALDKLPDGSPARALVERILAAARQAAELADEMLAYSGQGRFVVKAVDAVTVVQDTLALARASLPKHIDIRVEAAPGSHVVQVEVTQIRQLMMNLLSNAAESMGLQAGAVTVTVCTREVGPDVLARSATAEDLPPGLYVELAVTDTGVGMDPATAAQLFDPFFTTKRAGRGLGMATVLGVVRGHRGAVLVDSSPGRGTKLTVLLPASEAEPAAGGPTAAVSAAPPARTAVLVVDDVETVRSLACAVLEHAGLTVLEAADGVEALEVLGAHAASLGAVVLDLSMPRMGGAETLRALRERWPALPVLLSSGYSEDFATGALTSDPHLDFIKKPYAPRELLARLGQLMAR